MPAPWQRGDHDRVMAPTGASNSGRHAAAALDADAALEAALAALRRWAEQVGIDAARVIGPLAGPVAERRTCALLGLTPAPNPLQAGWDASDEGGRTYQIKARSFTGSRGTSFDFRSEHAFDEALLVLYDPDALSLVEVWRIDRATVLRHADADGDRFTLQWPAARRFARLVFARDVAWSLASREPPRPNASRRGMRRR